MLDDFNASAVVFCKCGRLMQMNGSKENLIWLATCLNPFCDHYGKDYKVSLKLEETQTPIRRN